MASGVSLGDAAAAAERRQEQRKRPRWRPRSGRRTGRGTRGGGGCPAATGRGDDREGPASDHAARGPTVSEWLIPVSLLCAVRIDLHRLGRVVERRAPGPAPPVAGRLRATASRRLTRAVQFGGQDHAAWHGIRCIDGIDEEAGHLAAHLLDRLADACQLWRGRSGDGRSSNPTTATSAGTCRPDAWMTAIAAAAIWSEAANTPSISGWAWSRWVIAADAPSRVNSPRASSERSGLRPDSISASRYPCRRSMPGAVSRTPVIVAMTRRPDSMRCPTADWAPCGCRHRRS